MPLIIKNKTKTSYTHTLKDVLSHHPSQQHPITSKLGQTCCMGGHLVNVQQHKQRGPAWNATQVINSDGEQLISSSSVGLCLSAYREAELPRRVGWWKWRLFAELLPAGGQKGLNQSQLRFNLHSSFRCWPLLVFTHENLWEKGGGIFLLKIKSNAHSWRQTLPVVPCWTAWPAWVLPPEKLFSSALLSGRQSEQAVLELCVSGSFGWTSQ